MTTKITNHARKKDWKWPENLPFPFFIKILKKTTYLERWGRRKREIGMRKQLQLIFT